MHNDAIHITAQSSGLLNLVSDLALCTQTVLLKMQPICAGDCTASLAPVEVIDIIRSAPRVAVPPAMMLTTVEKCLGMISTEFGFGQLTPKFHWLLHFPSHLQKYKSLLDCLCLVRKHRAATRHRSEYRGIRVGATKSLLGEVTSRHLGQLNRPSAFCFEACLVGCRSAPKHLQGTLLASF